LASVIVRPTVASWARRRGGRLVRQRRRAAWWTSDVSLPGCLHASRQKLRDCCAAEFRGDFKPLRSVASDQGASDPRGTSASPEHRLGIISREVP